MRKQKIDNVNEIIDTAFGCWITALWGTIKVHNENLTFPEHKEAFFMLLKRLLDDEKVVCFPPEEYWSNTHYDTQQEFIETMTMSGMSNILRSLIIFGLICPSVLPMNTTVSSMITGMGIIVQD